MSDIIEYNTYFEFELIYFNQKHGSYAIYCLDEIPTKSYKIRLHKKMRDKNMNKLKLSDYKKYIKEHFTDYGIDFKSYYQHILLNNEHAWLFCNPQNFKKSFNTIGNNLQFLVLKQLIKKHNYKLTFYKHYNTLIDRLEKTNNYKKCYSLHKPFYKQAV